MIKNAAVVLGALLLSATALPAFAQSSSNTDEGRPHTSNSPTRELTRMCQSEAKDKKLSGKERRSFLRDCQSNQVAPSSGSSSSASSAKSAPGAMTDAEGRTQGNVNTSKFNKRGPSGESNRPAGPNVDADGKPRAR